MESARTKLLQIKYLEETYLEFLEVIPEELLDKTLENIWRNHIINVSPAGILGVIPRFFWTNPRNISVEIDEGTSAGIQGILRKILDKFLNKPLEKSAEEFLEESMEEFQELFTERIPGGNSLEEFMEQSQSA